MARQNPGDPYPMHTRLTDVQPRSQAAGEFLDWLISERGYTLAQYIEGSEQLWPASSSIRELLAEFYAIDLEQLEAEKRTILNEQRRLNDRAR